MATAHHRLLAAIADNDVVSFDRLLTDDVDLDVPFDDGAPILFAAVLHGNEHFVLRLIQSGANPNFIAHEPACDTYAPKPLDLAMQARFLMDWDKFAPIVNLLQQNGATDSDGQQESETDYNVRRTRAFNPDSGPQRRTT